MQHCWSMAMAIIYEAKSRCLNWNRSVSLRARVWWFNCLLAISQISNEYTNYGTLLIFGHPINYRWSQIPSPYVNCNTSVSSLSPSQRSRSLCLGRCRLQCHRRQEDTAGEGWPLSSQCPSWSAPHSRQTPGPGSGGSRPGCGSDQSWWCRQTPSPWLQEHHEASWNEYEWKKWNH